MQWLNYHHLFYFWHVAREGSIARACRKLLLSQPTISGQLRELDQALGTKLFQRTGRGLALTDAGQIAFRYADEIFTLGREMQDALAQRPTGRPLRFAIGVVDALSKLIVYRLIEPALRLPEEIELDCQEDKREPLLTRLAMFDLDIVLSDAPAGSGAKIKAYNHLLGECGVTFFATASLARSRRRHFPRSLDAAPFLLPMAGAPLRRALEQWFDEVQVRPLVRGQFEDGALMKSFAQAGAGIFCGPSVIERETCRQYRVAVVGRTDAVRERFYAISVERRLRHPAVLAITQAAREKLFRTGED